MIYPGLNTRIKLLDILKSELIMGIEHSWGDKRIITYKVSRMEIILNKSPYEEFFPISLTQTIIVIARYRLPSSYG